MAIAIPIALFAAGVGLSMAAKIKAGNTAEAVGKYNADVAESESKTMQASAAFESETLRNKSEFDQAKIRREKGKTESVQRLRYAKAGVRIDEGSPIEVIADTASQYELDIDADRYNLETELERIRFNTQVGKSRLQSESEFQRSRGKSAKRSGYIGATSTLLTSVGTAMFLGGFGMGSTSGGVGSTSQVGSGASNSATQFTRF